MVPLDGCKITLAFRIIRHDRVIGDAYAKMGRNCDDWTSRLAVLAAIEKYSYAKSIDSEVADDANRRIGQYSGSIPTQQDAFMRGLKEGQAVSVGCGIGETVTLRFIKGN